MPGPTTFPLPTESRQPGLSIQVSNMRKCWEKNVLGAGGALTVGGEAKGRAWECEATTQQPGLPWPGK